MKQPQKDYGIAILKIISCFGVVIVHCSNEYETGFFGWVYYLACRAVLVFMLLSFVLCYDKLKNYDIRKLLDRVIKLYVPVLFWAIVYFAVLFIFQKYTGDNIRIIDLLWQMTTAHDQFLNPAMWFSIDLILLTVLLWIVGKIGRNNYAIEMGLLFLIVVAGFAMQYTGFNSYLWGETRFEIKYTMGRMAEMLPVAAIGSLCSAVKKVPIIIHQWIRLIASTVIIMLIHYLGINTISTEYSFGYAGVENCIVALALFAMFYQSNELDNKVAENIVNRVTSYTLGIYCMHVLVNKMLCALRVKFSIPIEKRTVTWCILVYLTCYSLSWLGSRLLPNKIHKYIL